MQDPLKQGLKQFSILKLHFRRNNSNARSTKTRIETAGIIFVRIEFVRIRMQDPLKQGLKPNNLDGSSERDRIRMQDPLKQGLKLFVILLVSRVLGYSNARSTKTRIETP